MRKFVSKEDIDYIRAHYADEANEDIARAIGFSVRTVELYRTKLHLRKNAEFMSKLNREKAIKYDNYMHLNTPAAIMKREETQHKMVKSEKIRLKWGLDQRTKWHFRVESRDKLLQRNRLVRLGYLIDETTLTAYYTESTHRAVRLEKIKRGERKGKLKPYYDFKPYGELDTKGI